MLSESSRVTSARHYCLAYFGKQESGFADPLSSESDVQARAGLALVLRNIDSSTP
jgi:hypothetical protein